MSRIFNTASTIAKTAKGMVFHFVATQKLVLNDASIVRGPDQIIYQLNSPVKLKWNSINGKAVDHELYSGI